MKKKYLIVAAHPDDETLGCGGLIYSLIRKKNDVRVIFLGEGSSCRFSNNDNKEIINKEIEKRQKFCLNALKILRVKKFHFYNLKCGMFDQISILKITKIIEEEIQRFKPDVLLTHSINDLHKDHQLSFQASLQATRPGTRNSVKELLSFEILSSSEKNFEKTFAPNYFFELDKVSIEKKIKALKCYKSEIGKHPFSRSALNIKSLALYRGSQAGTYYAEAFKIIRLIKTK